MDADCHEACDLVHLYTLDCYITIIMFYYDNMEDTSGYSGDYLKCVVMFLDSC